MSRLLRPNVVHRLPGRLRIYIPAIRHIPQEFEELAGLIIEKFRYPVFVQSAELNTTTGTLLIVYSVEHAKEVHVLQWIDRILDFILEMGKKLGKLSKNQRNKAARLLVEYTKNHPVDLERKDEILDIIEA